MALTLFSLNKFRIGFASWWLIWSALQTIMIYWLGYPLSTAFLDSVISNFLLACCCLLVTVNLKYYQPKQERYWFILVLSIILSALWQVLSRLLLYFANEDQTYREFVSKSIPVRFGVGFLLTGCMAMISMIWYSLSEQKEIESRKAETEKLAKEAELVKLRNQLQPHFLFNSLNSINALIGIDPEQARTMIQQLSDFLRGTIRREEQLSITVEEELQYLGLYLAIEKQRFGHRLTVVIETEDASLALKLPNMLLQPIVENAIKFGLYDTTGDITIKVTSAVSNGNLVITVENPFDPDTAKGNAGTGFGLRSIQRRLQLLYSRTDLLETSTVGEQFTVTVRIPQVSI